MDINIKLLEAILSYPLLYNQNHEQYHDSVAKQRAYDEIARKLKMRTELVRGRYRHLREAYARSLKNKTCKYKYHVFFEEIMDKRNKKDLLPQTLVKKDRPVRKGVRVLKSTVKVNDDTLLIDAVECRPLLYNRAGLPNETRKAIWDEVAENLNRTGERKTKIKSLLKHGKLQFKTKLLIQPTLIISFQLRTAKSVSGIFETHGGELVSRKSITSTRIYLPSFCHTWTP